MGNFQYIIDFFRVFTRYLSNFIKLVTIENIVTSLDIDLLSFLSILSHYWLNFISLVDFSFLSTNIKDNYPDSNMFQPHHPYMVRKNIPSTLSNEGCYSICQVEEIKKIYKILTCCEIIFLIKKVPKKKCE